MKIKNILLAIFVTIASVCLIPMQHSFVKVMAEELSAVTFSAIDGVNNSDQESYTNLFDGKKSQSQFTKWFVSMEKEPYVVIKASAEIGITKYTFVAGNDNATVEAASGRNPKSWKLLGSLDYNETSKTGTWQTIQTVTNDTTMAEDVNFKEYTFTVENNSTAYQYYKFEFTDSQNGEAMQLCEMSFAYSDKNGTENNIYGDFKILNGTQWVDFTFDTTENTLNILTSKQLEIANVNYSTESKTGIIVESGVAGNIVLAGVNINTQNCNYISAIKIARNSTANVKITIKTGTSNKLVSGYGGGIDKSGNDENIGTLTIDGKGTLYVEGDFSAAGIGSGALDVTKNIEILDGNITAVSRGYAAGIGGGQVSSNRGPYNASNILIRGGTITAKCNYDGYSLGAGKDGGASNVLNFVISGGSIKTPNGVNCTPTDGEGNNVYLLKIYNPNNQKVLIDGSEYTPYSHTTLNDDNLYAYVTGVDHSVKIGETTKNYHFISSTSTFTECSASTTVAHNGDYHWNTCVVDTCDVEFNKVSHSYSNIQNDDCKKSNMTCTVPAKYYKSCSVCGEKSSETFDVGTPTHSFQEIVESEHIKQNATCIAPAKYYKSCSVCGENGTDVFESGEPLGHNCGEDDICTRCERLVGTTVGSFGVSGGENNVDYKYENNILYILTSTQIRITQVDLEVAITDTIVIKKDISANITLAGIHIDLFGQKEASCLTIEENSSAVVTITIENGTTIILKSGSQKQGISRVGHTQSLIINANGSLVIQDSGAVGIDAGYVSQGVKDVVLGGGFIKIENTNAFATNVVPVNNGGDNLYRFVASSSGAGFTIDSTTISANYYTTPTDDAYYTYLIGTTHTVTISDVTKTYHFKDLSFMECAKGTVLEHDSTSHWTKCFDANCDVKYDVTTHNYNQRVVSSEYLKTSADCNNDATYYNSCICGEKTSDENSYFTDSSSALGHSYTKVDGSTNYGSNDTFHWSVCIRCGYIHSYSYEGHNFDRSCGDCTCSDCGKVVFKEHNVLKEYHWLRDNINHWYGCHYRTDDCDYKESLAPHTFVWIADSEAGYHVKRCSVCFFVDNTTKQACHFIVTDKNSEVHYFNCEHCGRGGNIDYHIYDNECDSTCDTCNYVRTAPHVYDNSCDTECNLCGVTRTASHQYDNDCDSNCNVCGQTREITHDIDADLWDYNKLGHWHYCEICEQAQNYASHTFSEDNNLICSVCGFERATPITTVKLGLAGYRFGCGLSWDTRAYSCTKGIIADRMVFGTDSRILNLDDNMVDYVIQDYSAFFNSDTVYYGIMSISVDNDYDVSTLLAKDFVLTVGANQVSASNVRVFQSWSNVNAYVVFTLPQLSEEDINEIDSEFNFKLSNYEEGKSAKDICVELKNTVAEINFDKNGYGVNYFISSGEYIDEAFENILDKDEKLKNYTYYLLIIHFDTKLNNQFGYYNDYVVTLDGYGECTYSDFSTTDCFAFFELHPLGATPIDNLNFTYSGYEVDKKIVDIVVNYDDTEGIETADTYYEEYYNYRIVTDLDKFFGDDYDENEESMVDIDDNGRFVANKDYYLVVFIYPVDSNYSLENFEQANVTFNTQKATRLYLESASNAFAIYKLPQLTTAGTTLLIDSLNIDISGYRVGEKVGKLTFTSNSTGIEPIVFGGDVEKEGRVRMSIHTSPTSTEIVWGSGGSYTFNEKYRYELDFIIRAQDGYSFYGLTSDNVNITSINAFTRFAVSAGGGFVYISAYLPFLNAYHEHKFEENVVDSAIKTSATCVSDAVYYLSCSCGELSSQTFVSENSKLGHDMSDEWSCEQNGHYHLCKRVGCAYQEDYASHTPDRESATETAPIKCSACGYVISPIINHTHTISLVSSTPATCLHNGTKAYYVCSGCEEKFEDEAGLNAISNFADWVVITGTHTFSQLTTLVSATCLASGTKAHKTCEHCGKYFDADNNEILNITIPRLNHLLTDVENVWPTCSQTGVQGHYHCSLCNKNYNVGGEEITDVTIPVDDRYHNIKFVKDSPATCVSKGTIKHYECELCHKCYDMSNNEVAKQQFETEIDADAHKFTDWIEQVPSTTTQKGTIAHKDCEHCHKHFDENGVELTDISLELLPAKKLSGGAIAGITVGGVALVGVGGFSIYWFIIKKRKFLDIFKK